MIRRLPAQRRPLLTLLTLACCLLSGCGRVPKSSLAVIVIDVSPSGRPDARKAKRNRTRDAASASRAAAEIVRQRCREARSAIAELEDNAAGVFKFQLMQVGSGTSTKPKTIFNWREVDGSTPSALATPQQIGLERDRALQQLEQDCVARAEPTATSPIHIASKEAVVALQTRAAELSADGRREIVALHLFIFTDFVDPEVLGRYQKARKDRALADRVKRATKRAKYEARALATETSMRIALPATVNTVLCGLADSEASVPAETSRAAWQLVFPGRAIAPSCCQTDMHTRIAVGH